MQSKTPAAVTDQSANKVTRRSYKKPQLNKLGSVGGLTQASYTGAAKTDMGIYS